MVLKFALLLFLVLLNSCGTNIVVTPIGCKSRAVWSENTSSSDFRISKSVWAPFGGLNKTVVKLKDVLGQGGVSCKDVGTLNITTTYSWQDVIRSVIPFASSRTVIVSGNYISRQGLHSTDGVKILASSHDE